MLGFACELIAVPCTLAIPVLTQLLLSIKQDSHSGYCFPSGGWGLMTLVEKKSRGWLSENGIADTKSLSVMGEICRALNTSSQQTLIQLNKL